MQLLYRAASFTSSRLELRKIYLIFIRSILEQSAVVWHSSLTAKNRLALERVQKNAVRVILGQNISNYKDGLQKLNLQSLNERRKLLCLRFAKNCLKNEKVKNMFPRNLSRHAMEKRKTRKYKNLRTRRKRYKNLPFLSCGNYFTQMRNKKVKP